MLRRSTVLPCTAIMHQSVPALCAPGPHPHPQPSTTHSTTPSSAALQELRLHNLPVVQTPKARQARIDMVVSTVGCKLHSLRGRTSIPFAMRPLHLYACVWHAAKCATCFRGSSSPACPIAAATRVRGLTALPCALLHPRRPTYASAQRHRRYLQSGGRRATSLRR